MKDINKYLYYGYGFPRLNNFQLPQSVSVHCESFRYTPQCVAAVLDYVFDDLIYQLRDIACVVIPISGGWDSRILLGAAMERFEHKQIKTVSFGVPGQLDFDIGRQIAKKFGLEHQAVDLSKVELTWEALLTSVQESPWTYVPDGYFNRLAVSQVARSDKDIVLSGFMGESLTGGHLSCATTKDEAIEEFVNKQRREKSVRLYSPEFDPRSALPNLPDESPISYSELLDFGVRQASCIAPIVTPQKQWQGWGGDMGCMPSTGTRVLAPFAHPEWVAYWLSVPKELKRGQKLYLEMMRYKFPELAAMPSKYSLGARTKIGHFAAKVLGVMQTRLDRAFPKLGMRYCARLNYLDYARAFRDRESYRGVLDKALSFLKESDAVPWLDLDALKKQHSNYEANHEKVFLVLIGLALNCNRPVNPS